MKTLHNHLILYDAECPMCNLYTRAFVKHGWLEPNGREPYQRLAGGSCPTLDWQRAVDEIALVNQETAEVTYGVESLLKVCGNAMPVWQRLFEWRPFLWVARRAYAFISYNRRVIVPGSASGNQFALQPSFKLGYRIAWILMAWFATAALFTGFFAWIATGWRTDTYIRELAVTGGLFLFQSTVMLIYQKNKLWDYLGSIATISLAGAIIVFVLQFVILTLHLSWYGSLAALLLVGIVVFLEHLRRCRLLGLGYLISFTWVLYRVVLLAAFYFN